MGSRILAAGDVWIDEKAVGSGIPKVIIHYRSSPINPVNLPVGTAEVC